MNLLLVQREGIDLYHTLLSSETSRGILKFYRPRRLDFGVEITCASMGSALSLASELRWYLRRYTGMVLFEVAPGRYCTHALAREVYERERDLHEPWDFKQRIGIVDGSIAVIRAAGRDADDGSSTGKSGEADVVLEVWCSEKEYEES